MDKNKFEEHMANEEKILTDEQRTEMCIRDSDIGCLANLLSDSRASGGVGCGIVVHSKSS